MSGQPVPRPRRRVVGAITMSVGLVVAVLAFLTELDVKLQFSVIIALLGVLLGGGIDYYFKLADVERTNASLRADLDRIGVEHTTSLADLGGKVATLGPILDTPNSFRAFVSRIAPHWTKIDKSNYEFLVEILDAYRDGFQKRMQDLADGSIEISSQRPYSFRSAPLDRLQDLRMVDKDLSFWSSNQGRAYLRRQGKLIKAGKLAAKRIFIVAEADQARGKDIVAAHHRAGIEVFILRPEDLAPQNRDHLVDQGVVTDRNGCRMLVKPLDQTRELLSYKRADIQSALHSIRILEDCSLPVLNVYPDLA